MTSPSSPPLPPALPHALLLAAGLGKRFRESAGNAAAEKLLHVVETPAGFMPMGIAAASALRAAGLDVTVVVRPKSPAAYAYAASHFDTIEARDAQLGMGHSLAAGIAATHAAGSRGGWLVALADMPYVLPSTITAIARALSVAHHTGDTAYTPDTAPDTADTPRIVQPSFNGERGHPVAFSHHFFDELTMLTGDQGARSLIAPHTCY
jgi:molybdenum cofactor cytidylyltransferase